MVKNDILEFQNFGHYGKNGKRGKWYLALKCPEKGESVVRNSVVQGAW
jgi:hypothetical protein